MGLSFYNCQSVTARDLVPADILLASVFESTAVSSRKALSAVLLGPKYVIF